MNIGFVGVGKLGRDVAEVMSKFHDVVGYDISKIDTTITMVDTIQEAVHGKDIVFVAVPTQHDQEYDGRHPSSHLEPKDFNYDIAIEATKNVDLAASSDTLIVMISTMLPGTVRRD